MRYDAANNHILHTLLVKLSTALNGNAEWAIRLPAFTFGVLVLPASFLLFRKLYGTTAGMIGLSLVATSSPLIEYSVSARGYSTITCAFVSMLVLGDYALRHRSIAGWAIFALIGALGAFTVPSMVEASSMVWSWLALRVAFGESHGQRLSVLAELIVVGLGMITLISFLYVPVFAVNGTAVLTNTVISATSPNLGKTASDFLWELFANWHLDYPPLLSVLIVFGVGVAVVFHSTLSCNRVPLFLLAPLIIIVHALVLHEFGFKRSWLFILPVYLGTAAAGFYFVFAKMLVPLKDSPRKCTVEALLAIVLCAVSGLVVITSRSVIASSEAGLFPAAKRAIYIIKDRAREHDLVGIPTTMGLFN